MPSNFLNVLPDPNYKITSAGFENVSGVAGQGFVSINVIENNPPILNRTINGKLIPRKIIMPWFDIDLRYNFMTKAQFDPINNFLLEKKGSRKSFFVSLPQYYNPKNSAFKTWLVSNDVLVSGAHSAGASTIVVGTWSGNNYSGGLPSFGDLFTISDPNNSLHTKAYQVVRVETFSDYLTGFQPATTTIRLHISPGLQRNVASGSELVFLNPLIKVRLAQDVQEYNLNTENLYNFSVKLTEVFY